MPSRSRNQSCSQEIKCPIEGRIKLAPKKPNAQMKQESNLHAGSHCIVNQASMQSQWCNRRSTNRRPFPFGSNEVVSKETHAQSSWYTTNKRKTKASIEAWKFEASLEEVRRSIKACQNDNKKTPYSCQSKDLVYLQKNYFSLIKCL